MSTTSSPGSNGGVQSLHRALDLVETIYHRGGELTISELAAVTALPLPTIHRLLQTLADRGYVRQLSNRRYALGFRFVPLGGLASATVGADAETVLAELVAELGESANLAVLSGDRAQYVAQVPSPHAMRMFTEVGRQVDLHASGVGKALLAQLEASQAHRIIARTGLPSRTPYTITSEPDLLRVLDEIRRLGYAMDEQEQEIGVRCVAVALTTSNLPSMAVSLSGPTQRITDDMIARALPLLHQAARRLSAAATAQRPH